MDEKYAARIATRLARLYPGTDLLPQLQAIIAEQPIAPRSAPDALGLPMLIAYGDHMHEGDEAPLATLHRFARAHLKDLIGSIHLLPFFVYTSDDGFSVVDYRTVNPDLGNWTHIAALRQDFPLMFDLVLNHVSVSSEWFQRFLRDEEGYRDYFVTVDPSVDLSTVVRPRTHPLLTPFDTLAGQRYVWTTFSTDQVDLNYSNPAVLLEMIAVLLDYVRRGADYVRLDAVAFLWKIPGTTSIHLEETHIVIRLLRDVLEVAAPWVRIITETNVPHLENIRYFGSGDDEAHLVYQFALPPLVLHTLLTGDAATLSSWAVTLATPSRQTAFFNFTASHDGVGMRPVSELLKPDDIERLMAAVQDRGGRISYRANPDGTQGAYELNSTYFDLLMVPGEPLDRAIDRFMCSQAIMLALRGLPAIYLSSLFGAPNWTAGLEQTGRARTLNRQKFDLSALEAALADPTTRTARVFTRYAALLKARAAAGFAAEDQQVLLMDASVFAVQRGPWLLLHNVTGEPVRLALPDPLHRTDILSGAEFTTALDLTPYQTAWLHVTPVGE